MGKQDFDNYDKSLAEEFASKMFQFLNGGMLSLMISIGYKTGLFDILSELEPSTSQEIAQETKLDERYVREWLGAMVTGKIVNYDPLMRKYAGGYCVRCYNSPTKKVSYDIGGAQLVERYCDICYQKHEKDLGKRLKKISL